ncbi:MAG: hypothetical protein FWD84_07405, partial [Oscillospiraceae bacterium]|nr:hypothetical protein [Oscillospiraceae bacterium]
TTEPHGHFVCSACRAVSDISVSMTEPEMVTNLEQMGFAVDRVDLTVYGTCNTCLTPGKSTQH